MNEFDDYGKSARRRIGWGVVLLVLLMIMAGPLALYSMKWWESEAFKPALKALPPAERVEKLTEARAEYASSAISGEGTSTLKGTLRAPGGKPITKPVPAASIVRSGPSTASSSLNPLNETFSVEVQSGLVWLSLTPEGFAPVMAGPFEARPGATVEGIDIVFEPGFPARVRVVDENGAPVVAARVAGGLVVNGGSVSSASGLVTDGDGVVTVPHAASGPYSMSVQATGFQTFEPREVTLSRDETTVLTLVHARPTAGVVVGPDGAPVADATIRPLARSKPQFSRYYGTSEPVLATTDQDGRFTLDALDDGWNYAMLIETDHLGRRVVKDVRAGLTDLKWGVGPELTISGTVKGDLTALETERGKPVVEVSQRGRKDGTGEGISGTLIRTTVAVERTDTGGRFQVTGALPGEVVIVAGEHVVTIDVEKPDNPVTIDLTEVVAAPTRRRVVLRVVTPEGAAPATGAIVGYVNDSRVERNSRPLDQPLKAGEASFEVPAPGTVSYQARSVIGYWFKDGQIEVPPGDWPVAVEVEGVPAGAIVGRVLDADGKPAVGVSLGVATVDKPPGLKSDESVQLNNVSVGAGGRFFLGPLPIGGTYVVIAAQGHNRQVSKLVWLDGSTATGNVEVRLAGSVPAGGRVVGPDGQPVAGAEVTLRLDHPRAGTSWGPPTPTDRDGRFRFDDLNPDLGFYAVSLDIRRDYQPAEAKLNPGGPPVEIRLTRGLVVTGRVVDAGTGWPIPGVEVYAARKSFQVGQRHAFEAEAKTDDQGRFRFSTLPEGEFQLNDRTGLRWESDGSRAVAAGQKEAVEVRATLPDWSTLRPVAPKGG